MWSIRAHPSRSLLLIEWPDLEAAIPCSSRKEAFLPSFLPRPISLLPPPPCLPLCPSFHHLQESEIDLPDRLTSDGALVLLLLRVLLPLLDPALDLARHERSPENSLGRDPGVLGVLWIDRVVCCGC
jgi:hypothetical protein